MPLAQEEGLLRRRPNPTVVLSIIDAKTREASSIPPCRSQVMESLQAPFLLSSSPLLVVSLTPTFLQGCLPRTQTKDSHLSPLSSSLSVEDASGSTGKRQTCDIEGEDNGSYGVRGVREVD